MSIDSSALATFLAVHRSGGFARAGEVLHLSQPAISRRIAQLEEALGVPLFERAAGSGRLSEAGEMLVPWAERALAAISDCQSAMNALKAGESGRITLAIVGTLAGPELTARLKLYARAHPGVALNLRTATSQEVSNLVRAGDATLGLRYHMDGGAGLDCERVGQERLVVICAPDHPALGVRGLELLDLAGERWLAFPDAANPEASANTIVAQFLARGHSGLNWSAVDSLTAQKRMAEAGFGLALVPQSAVLEEIKSGSLAVLDLPAPGAANPICLVSRKEGYLSPAAQFLRALLRAGDNPA